MEILLVISFVVSLIAVIVFFVMASNVGDGVGMLRSSLVNLDTIRRYLRIMAKHQAGIELSTEEKAMLVEPDALMKKPGK